MLAKITDIKALFSCRYANISHLLTALPGVNVSPPAMEAEISSLFVIFFCVCWRFNSLGDTGILEREGKCRVQERRENETSTTGTRQDRTQEHIAGKCRTN